MNPSLVSFRCQLPWTMYSHRSVSAQAPPYKVVQDGRRAAFFMKQHSWNVDYCVPAHVTGRNCQRACGQQGLEVKCGLITPSDVEGEFVFMDAAIRKIMSGSRGSPLCEKQLSRFSTQSQRSSGCHRRQSTISYVRISACKSQHWMSVTFDLSGTMKNISTWALCCPTCTITYRMVLLTVWITTFFIEFRPDATHFS